MPRPQFTLRALLLAMLVVGVACGSAAYGSRWWRRNKQMAPYPAIGVITIDGRDPAVGWVVTFWCSDWWGWTAVGTTDDRGIFKLTTPGLHAPGACPGVYLAGLTPPKQWPGEGFERYADPHTSGIEAVVKPGFNEFRFDLSASQK